MKLSKFTLHEVADGMRLGPMNIQYHGVRTGRSVYKGDAAWSEHAVVVYPDGRRTEARLKDEDPE